VLNFLLVIPHFKDLRRVRAELAETRKKISDRNKVILDDIDPVHGKTNELYQLEKQQGGGIATQRAGVNEQVALQRSVSDQALKTGVNISDLRSTTSTKPHPDAFYNEESVRISFESDEGQLVNFLYSIGNDAAMIRVGELNLRIADANRYRLKGDASLTANYARNPASPAPAAAAKPGAAPSVPDAGHAPAPAPHPAPAVKQPPQKLIVPPGAQQRRKNL
jgi:hypothetical protein